MFAIKILATFLMHMILLAKIESACLFLIQHHI